MKITTKLVASFTTIIALGGVMGVVGYRGLQETGAALEEGRTVRAPSVEGLLTVQRGFYPVLAANAAWLNKTCVPEERDHQARFRDGCSRDIWGVRATREPLPQGPEEALLVEALAPQFEGWKPRAHRVIQAQGACTSAGAAGHAHAADAALAAAGAECARAGWGLEFIATRLEAPVDPNVSRGTRFRAAVLAQPAPTA
jgi:hypothetical protein